MGYRIQYNPEHKKKYPIKLASAVRRRWLVGIAIAVVLFMGIAGLSGGELLKSWLLPGAPEVTEAALFTMVEDIRAGESLGNAVTAFCLEIMDHARIR